MVVLVNVITPQGLEPLQFPPKFRSPSAHVQPETEQKRPREVAREAEQTVAPEFWHAGAGTEQLVKTTSRLPMRAQPRPPQSSPGSTGDNPELLPIPDRRTARRCAPSEVPRVLSVRLATGEWAELIDVSSGGALVRTHGRPPMDPLKHVRPDPEPAGGLVFRLAQGEKIHVAGRVVRCQVASVTQGSLLYGVAFRFDDPLSLDLPSDPPVQFPAESFDADMSVGAAQAHAQGGTGLAGDLFNHLTRTSQNRADWLADRDFGNEEQALLARLPGDVWLPDGVREAVAQLALVSAELFQLQTEGFNERHTGPAQPDLASRLGARIRELNYLRDELVERIYRGCGPLLEPQDKLPQAVAPVWAPESASSLAATSYVGTYSHPACGEATVLRKVDRWCYGFQVPPHTGSSTATTTCTKVRCSSSPSP